MRKGDIYEGIVEKIEFPNKGILHIDGERVVIKNAIPGQKIQCVITKRRKGKSEARTLEILEHSPAERPEEACRGRHLRVSGNQGQPHLIRIPQ